MAVAILWDVRTHHFWLGLSRSVDRMTLGFYHLGHWPPTDSLMDPGAVNLAPIGSGIHIFIFGGQTMESTSLARPSAFDTANSRSKQNRKAKKDNAKLGKMLETSKKLKEEKVKVTAQAHIHKVNKEIGEKTLNLVG